MSVREFHLKAEEAFGDTHLDKKEKYMWFDVKYVKVHCKIGTCASNFLIFLVSILFQAATHALATCLRFAKSKQKRITNAEDTQMIYAFLFSVSSSHTYWSYFMAHSQWSYELITLMRYGF